MIIRPQPALSSPGRSRPREGMKFNSQLREKFIYGQFNLHYFCACAKNWDLLFSKRNFGKIYIIIIRGWKSGHDDEPDYNTDHSAYQQEYTPVSNRQSVSLLMSKILQQEYSPPSFDYSSSSPSAADEKFLTSDPGNGFSFGGFSQVTFANIRVRTKIRNIHL